MAVLLLLSAGLTHALTETSLAFAIAPPAITTQASGSVTLGGSVSDTAVVTGSGIAPTGTVTFMLYGPGDANCTSLPVFTSAPVPLVPGAGASATATSGNFTPTAVGNYQWVASYSGDPNYVPVLAPCNDPNESVSVTLPVPTVTTQASANVVLGGSVSDTATVAGGSSPTGTVTFTLYGPDDATCAGAPVFTSIPVALTGGTVNSGNFTPTAVGTYRWRAFYSGDANNAPVATPCNDTNESVVVTQATPTLTTQASGTTTIGGAVSDTATVTGGFNPTGTVTFRLYGPNDAICAGTPIFTSAPVPLTGGTANSGNFTPTAVGTYRWRASYSGDANNAPVATACNDANESVVVTQATPAVTTQASGTVAIGGSVSDTATITGGLNPTGTVTFMLYGPDDGTCASPPVFTSAPVPLAGGTATSGSFTPTAVGTYQWRASYSGDANNATVDTPCGDPNESVVVTQATPAMTTQASGTVVIGGSVSDTATVTGGFNPTGTVTFRLYGPDDESCSGTPAFTSEAVPLTGATANSGNFAPTAVGTYRWRASYSGDVNNTSVAAPCNAANESVVVTAPPNEAPDCSGVTASVTTLKADGKMTLVTLTGATDPDGDPVTITIDAVTQDEPVTNGKVDKTFPDASTASGNTVRLRGEAAAKGNGRVYRIGFTVSDGQLSCSRTAGPDGTTTVKVGVPARKGQVAFDDGSFSSWNSFTGLLLP